MLHTWFEQVNPMWKLVQIIINENYTENVSTSDHLHAQ